MLFFGVFLDILVGGGAVVLHIAQIRERPLSVQLKNNRPYTKWSVS